MGFNSEQSHLLMPYAEEERSNVAILTPFEKIMAEQAIENTLQVPPKKANLAVKVKKGLPSMISDVTQVAPLRNELATTMRDEEMEIKGSALGDTDQFKKELQQKMLMQEMKHVSQ